MERKIDEVFEFKGKTFRVKEDKDNDCRGCVFNNRCTTSVKAMVGQCAHDRREDNKNVVFEEVQEQPQELTEQPQEQVEQPQEQVEQPQEQVEQPQEQVEQPQGLNLCELLKHCPNGEKFWSPMLGDVMFFHINQTKKEIDVKLADGTIWGINADGTITIGYVTSSEIMLYPSREQRDWTKVKFEPKKEKFDPKTFKPFDKVLYRAKQIDLIWHCDFFSHMKDRIYVCSRCVSDYVVPYNDDTKYLVGTKEEAPEFYRYWED